MSHQAAISEEEKNTLLRNAGMNYTDSLDKIIDEIRTKIQPSVEGFKDKAMLNKESQEYIWAHFSAPGIIWLWAQQEEGIRQQWLKNNISKWNNYSPSYESSVSSSVSSSVMRMPSVSPSASTSAAAAAADNSNARSIGPFSVSIGSQGGGSRKRRTAHKKRKAHRKSKRVHHSRRKHTRRHRRSHSRHRR